MNAWSGSSSHLTWVMLFSQICFVRSSRLSCSQRSGFPRQICHQSHLWCSFSIALMKVRCASINCFPCFDPAAATRGMSSW
ncbi:hypothetical protein SFUMM280S_11295 [Streptomyces fumanus]